MSEVPLYKYFKQLKSWMGAPRQRKGKMRYGKVMLMTDQDHDGSHIMGMPPPSRSLSTYWSESALSS